MNYDLSKMVFAGTRFDNKTNSNVKVYLNPEGPNNTDATYFCLWSNGKIKVTPVKKFW